MKQVTREIRGAYIKMLQPLQYMGQSIPIKSGMQNGKGATITPATGITFEAYINIINQYRAINQIKNNLDYKTYITLDINTVFSGSSYNMAGAEWVEEITDLVYGLLYDEERFRLKEFGINNDRFVITGNSNYSQPMPVQYTDTSRVFRSVLTFELSIQSMTTIESKPDLWILTL